MHRSFVRLNEVFTEKIVEKCKDKKVLLTLSGGLDTRAILSVLCKHEIHCDAITHTASGVPWDVKIARKIAKDIKCINRHIVVNASSLEDAWKKLDGIYPDYDIVLHGEWISGLFDKYEHIELSERKLNERIAEGFKHIDRLKKRWPNAFFPAEVKEIRDALLDIPIFYRYFHYPQRCIIMLNYPKLMKYPYTTFNLRKRVARILHWKSVWIMEKIMGW